jgi:hypothetical protein
LPQIFTAFRKIEDTQAGKAELLWRTPQQDIGIFARYRDIQLKIKIMNSQLAGGKG